MRQAILQRRDSLDEAAEQARADSMVVADVEVPNGIDRYNSIVVFVDYLPSEIFNIPKSQPLFSRN
jgi:hypothetical protein